jgi:iron complex transport system permease protein
MEIFLKVNKRLLFICLSIIIFFIVFLFSLICGSSGISGIFKGIDTNMSFIMLHVRFPRTVMSCITGAALAVSGCVFQAILKNPLADPFTLGISSGAALGVAVAFVFGFASLTSFFIPIFAFLGAMVSVLIVYMISVYKRFNSNAMILSGIVVSYIFSSLIMLIFALSPSKNIQASFVWLIGNFNMFNEKVLSFAVVVVLVGIVFLSLSGNVINIMSLGIDKAKTIGADIERNVKFLFIFASFITSATVSVGGVIGFVGLMVPHIMRKIVGANNIILVPMSALFGAIFLLLCDVLSRVLFNPILIPVGIITSIIGGVFFVILLFKSRENTL